MGCAIGMTVAAACEIIYWITLKMVVKLMVKYNVTLTRRTKYLYYLFCVIVFLGLFLFCFHQFRNVYLTFMSRSYDLNEVV